MIFISGKELSALLIAWLISMFLGGFILFKSFINTKNTRKYQYLDSLLLSFFIAFGLGRIIYILFHLEDFNSVSWRFSIQLPIRAMFEYLPYKIINFWDGIELMSTFMVTMLIHVSLSMKTYVFSLKKALYFYNRFFMFWLLIFMALLSWWNRNAMSIGFIVLAICVLLILISHVLYTILNPQNIFRIRYIQITNLVLFLILSISSHVFDIEHSDFIYSMIFVVAFAIWNLYILITMNKNKDLDGGADIIMKDWK